MTRRSFEATLATAAVALALVAGPVHAQPDSTRAAARSGKATPAETKVRRGNLFSAVSLGDSTFGAEWSRIRDEARTRFPGLRMTDREALHITVVYIGGDWKTQDLDRIRAHALVVPAVPIHFTPEIVPLGRNNQVVVVELHGTPGVWADSVVAAKDRLNRLGLKKPESYDTNFRTHVTLAQASHSPPTPADSTELAGFLSWMKAKLAEDPGKFTVTVGPTTRVSLLLAGATRPEHAPEYIPVEDFLERQESSAPAK